jgi:hypothetical protein
VLRCTTSAMGDAFLDKNWNDDVLTDLIERLLQQVSMLPVAM